MTDLVEFLRARLDMDERVARGVEDGPGEVLRRGLDPLRIGVKDEVRFAYLTVDPARVLREVEAKRQIIDDHIELGIEGECARCVTWDEDQEGELCAEPLGYPCRTLRLLAEVYADHPDYRQEWKP